MRSNAAKALLGIAAVASAVALFVVLSDDGDGGRGVATSGDESPAKTARADRKPSRPRAPMIIVRKGKPIGGVAQLEYRRGGQIRFQVSSDLTDEVHIHGYDVSKQVRAGRNIAFDFPADIEGIFEVELEQRAEPIAELQVNP